MPPLAASRLAPTTSAGVRFLSSSRAAASATAVPSSSSSFVADTPPNSLTTYSGPLAPTFRRLKIFSLGSLGLATALTPFIFIIDAALPLSARTALAGLALATSGISTGLVGWCGAPYVGALRRTPAAVELDTTTFALRPRTTRVYDAAFFAATRRPFATLELAQSVAVARTAAGAPGAEETVAETVDGNGKVVGRWIVRWGEGGAGTCHGTGKVVRYFNVHEELLDAPLRP